MTTFATGNKLLNPEKILEEIGLDVGMRVADLGCGNGYFSLTASEMVGGRGQVYAVDILKSCLDTVAREASRHQLFNIKTVWSNLEKVGATDIQAASMDVVLVIHALYQAANKVAFLNEAVRLMKPGSKMLIIDWKPRPTPLGPPTEDRISEETLRTILKTAKQLKTVKGFTPGQYHFGLILEKVK